MVCVVVSAYNRNSSLYVLCGSSVPLESDHPQHSIINMLLKKTTQTPKLLVLRQCEALTEPSAVLILW